jgi:hypothetical protein
MVMVMVAKPVEFHILLLGQFLRQLRFNHSRIVLMVVVLVSVSAIMVVMVSMGMLMHWRCTEFIAKT